ncbi:MAG: aspartate/glutamate racemase family protein [Pseudomonadota bacterium]
MAETVRPLMLDHGPTIEMHTLREGPFGIESQADCEAVTLPLRAIAAARRDVDVFVIGCFSDPGLAVCREATTAAVLGIRECAVFAALSLGDSFGVVALGPASIKRQSRAFREMGVASRWAGSAPLHMSVAQAEADDAHPAVAAAATSLRDRGADAIILGCAGMTRHRAPLEAQLGVPIIDPTQAATIQALGLALLSAAAEADAPVSSERLRRQG